MGNAVLHRDYRYGKDIQIRIFDSRIEVESPGEFPANITAATISRARSAPRNPSLVTHAREFPNPPNVDAGEGVPMMFEMMRAQGLYPPQYVVLRDAAIPCVMVTLLNEQRPANWEQVSDWIDRHGAIANRDLRQIASVDTLDASRMLKNWVERGVLVADASQGKQKTVYRKRAVGRCKTAYFQRLLIMKMKFLESPLFSMAYLKFHYHAAVIMKTEIAKNCLFSIAWGKSHYQVRVARALIAFGGRSAMKLDIQA